MKDFYSSDKFFLILIILLIFSFSTFSSKSFYKSSLSEKIHGYRKYPQPQRDPNMNYIPCCCETPIGYYGWFHEIPKKENVYCNKYHTCIDDSFKGDCPGIHKKIE